MTENVTVETIETIETRITTRRKAERGGLTLCANVTERNGQITAINDISITTENETVWAGNASPNISGSFYQSGREIEVMEMLTAFLANVKSNNE
ncbi:MAG: hypothetical protein K2M69_00540 [Muribaculaceae bacterium]|nr:hypothetical protein [Muribaculaceae bacterium]